MNNSSPFFYLLTIALVLLTACSKPALVGKDMPAGQSNSSGMLKLHDFASKRISLNGLEFRYIDHGKGELIVFLHGFPYFADVWYKQIGELSQHYRTVAVDNRGYGYSSKPGSIEDYHLEKLVDDVQALIQQLSPNGSAVVVGHDWGGGLAWGLAQKYPESVNKLIVINSPPPNVFLSVLQKSQAQREASAYFDLLTNPLTSYYLSFRGADAFWGDSMKTMMANGDINDAFKQAYFNAWEQPGAFAGALNWYRANMPDFDDIREESYWPSKQARVTVPSLLIWSDEDVAFVKDTLDEIPLYVDDLTVKIIYTKSHTPFLDKHAAEVNKAILNFLTSGD